VFFATLATFKLVLNCKKNSNCQYHVRKALHITKSLATFIKNYQNRLMANKVIAKKLKGCSFLKHSVFP